MERRLAAILSADVVGYSRLMEIDEAGTLAALTAHRHELIDVEIAAHNGRIVKLMGDGALVEFASVVEAIECALAIQGGMAKRNESCAEDERIDLRIGIHLGDVIVEEEDIYGDGVNVAARLQALAEPGGIYVSGTVRDTHGGKKVDFEDLGEQQVKNIARPIRVYRVRLDQGRRRSAATKRAHGPGGRRLTGAVVIAAILFAGLAFSIWRPWAPDVEPASVEAMLLPLPDKPSIAVLPFANISGDPEQEYFADGITDDLTTDLSKLSDLFVISRNSAFSYKGRAVKVRQVAEDLGVRYVLEGSVRRAGDQVRINAQLTDALTGGHVWAERYDRRLDNIFEVQDEIAGNVATALELRLTEGAGTTVAEGPATENLEAYDLVLRARKLLTRFDYHAAREARALLERAIKLDLNYVEALTLLGLYYFDEWRLWGSNRDQNLALALGLAERAASLDPSDPAPQVLLAQIRQFRREFDLAEEHADRALMLDPNDAVMLANLGSMLRYASRHEDAVAVLERAIRLDPFHPPNYLEWLADAYDGLGRPADCIEVVKRGLALDPDFVALHVNAAQCYGALGENEKAREAAGEILRVRPNFTLGAFAAYVPYSRQEELERNVELLRQAGIPD